MLTFDPRSISTCVYRNLNQLKQDTPNSSAHKEQKSQAVELYTYVATWGLMRLKAEEFALSQNSKCQVVECFFKTLAELAFPNQPNPFLGQGGIDYLARRNASDYLGLTGLALQVSREFAFWAEAIYHDIQVTPNQPTSAG